MSVDALESKGNERFVLCHQRPTTCTNSDNESHHDGFDQVVTNSLLPCRILTMVLVSEVTYALVP